MIWLIGQVKAHHSILTNKVLYVPLPISTVTPLATPVLQNIHLSSVSTTSTTTTTTTTVAPLTEKIKTTTLTTSTFMPASTSPLTTKVSSTTSPYKSFTQTSTMKSSTLTPKLTQVTTSKRTLSFSATPRMTSKPSTVTSTPMKTVTVTSPKPVTKVWTPWVALKPITTEQFQPILSKSTTSVQTTRKPFFRATPKIAKIFIDMLPVSTVSPSVARTVKRLTSLKHTTLASRSTTVSPIYSTSVVPLVSAYTTVLSSRAPFIDSASAVTSQTTASTFSKILSSTQETMTKTEAGKHIKIFSTTPSPVVVSTTISKTQTTSSFLDVSSEIFLNLSSTVLLTNSFQNISSPTITMGVPTMEASISWAPMFALVAASFLVLVLLVSAFLLGFKV